MQLFCFGFGYVARHLAANLGDGWQVTGTVRTPESRLNLQQQGYHAFCYDDETGDFPEAGQTALHHATHVLISIPPTERGYDAAQEVMHHMRGVGNIRWLGYLSTTGVYGNHDGGWVDEQTRPTPSDELGERRLLAEEHWQAWSRQHDVPVSCFRLAGIYGPGRNALEQLKAGRARRIDKPGQYFSRIHVDDIVQVLRASMQQPDKNGVYNVCDDEPCESRLPVEFAAELMGVEPPPLVPFAQADLSPMGQRFYASNKRVRNGRIKDTLGVKLHHPTYRDGLRALCQQMAE